MEGNAQRTTARKATLKHNIHNRQEDNMTYRDYEVREFLKQLAGGLLLAIIGYVCICIVMGWK